MPENPTLLEPVTSSWSQNVSLLPSKLSGSSQMSTNKNQNEKKNQTKNFSFLYPLGNNHSCCNKSESLQLCTEGLGSESSDDVEDLQSEMINENLQQIKEEKVVSSSVKHVASGSSSGELKRSRMSREAFPPPLSFIGRSGKAGVWFTAYRQDGRFVLKEVRIPTQEFLQARREDGRLKLQIVQPNDYAMEEEDEDEADEEHDDVEEEHGVSSVRDNGQS